MKQAADRHVSQDVVQRVRTRTHQFPKNKPIDCTGWTEFTIVGETIRYHRIAFTEVVQENIDESSRLHLE